MDGIGEAAAAGAVAVLPVGATEQHGAHLPTGTDTLLAAHVAQTAAEQTGDVVLPPLAYGCSLGHTDHWPGTLSLHPTTMTAAVVELGRWVHASGFSKLVIVNGHATNGPPCQSAILQLRHELPDLRARFVSIFDLTPAIAERYTEDAPDFHANEA
jgi:creatinine amidohydrolase